MNSWLTSAGEAAKANGAAINRSSRERREIMGMG
jgi:hypothetical protein